MRRSPLHVEAGKRGDDPVLQTANETAHVAAAGLQVEHHIGHPLAGPVIGEAPAAPGAIDRKALRCQKLSPLGAGAGGIERRVLDEPDTLRGGAGGDGGGYLLHALNR